MTEQSQAAIIPLEFTVEGQYYYLRVIATGEVLLQGWSDDPDSIVDEGVRERIKAAATAFHKRAAS